MVTMVLSSNMLQAPTKPVPGAAPGGSASAVPATATKRIALLTIARTRRFMLYSPRFLRRQDRPPRKRLPCRTHESPRLGCRDARGHLEAGTDGRLSAEGSLRDPARVQPAPAETQRAGSMCYK